MTAECQFEILHQCHLQRDKLEALEVINHNSLTTTELSCLTLTFCQLWGATEAKRSLWHLCLCKEADLLSEAFSQQRLASLIHQIFHDILQLMKPCVLCAPAHVDTDPYKRFLISH